jgi:phosphatidylserine synthase
MSRSREEVSRPAAIADGLTAGRGVLAVFLFVAAAVGAYRTAATLLALAWWTDLLDGRFARRAEEPTRLGPWDPLFDALVGVAVLGGLLVAGEVSPLPWAAIGAVLLVAFVVSGNLSSGMLLQALGYAFFLAQLWTREPLWLGIVVVNIAALAALDAKRFWRQVLPTFFAGIGLGTARERTVESD